MDINTDDYLDIGEPDNSLTCFSDALTILKDGTRVARKGWNGKGMWLELYVPPESDAMTLPYIYMQTACGNKVPWLASQTDLLADDWYYV